jgi:glutaredoxin-related protein
MRIFTCINHRCLIKLTESNHRDWPTIPQLYVKGEFVGGCDIMTSMYKEGELQNKFKELGLVAKV